jgi:hypothetical protein
MNLKNMSVCRCTAFDSGSALQERRVSAKAELKRLMMRFLEVLVPHICRRGANLLTCRELHDGRQWRRISEERQRSLGGCVGLQVMGVVLMAITVAAWASGGSAANDKATMVPSTKAPDVADNLHWNWWGGSRRIIAETVTMAATDDVVSQVEVWIQGARPGGVPSLGRDMGRDDPQG